MQIKFRIVFFADCLGGLLSVVAQNITLDIEMQEGVQLLEVLSDYKIANRLQTSVSLQMGDLYSEENRDVLVRVHLCSLKEIEKQHDLVRFKLKYFNVLDAEFIDISSIASISRPDFNNRNVNPEVETQHARITAGQAIMESVQLAEKGDLEGARRNLEDAKKKVKAFSSNHRGYVDSLWNDMEECQQEMVNTQQFKEKGAKKMNWISQAHSKQRAVGEKGEFYSNDLKKELRSKAMSK